MDSGCRRCLAARNTHQADERRCCGEPRRDDQCDGRAVLRRNTEDQRDERRAQCLSGEPRGPEHAACAAAAIKALPIIKYHYAMAEQLAKLKGVTS